MVSVSPHSPVPSIRLKYAMFLIPAKAAFVRSVPKFKSISGLQGHWGQTRLKVFFLRSQLNYHNTWADRTVSWNSDSVFRHPIYMLLLTGEKVEDAIAFPPCVLYNWGQVQIK